MNSMQQMSEEQRRMLEEKIKSMSPEELKEFQKQQCIFCQIIAGKVPSKKVYEDDRCIALMDINPAAAGHVLLLPKEHYAIMPQIPDEEVGHLFLAAKYLSQVVLKKLKVEGTNVFVANGPAAGQKAQHFMIHIIPRKEGDGILKIPEQVIEMGAREKLAEIIKVKADQLFGIKKEKPLPPENPEEKEAKPQKKTTKKKTSSKKKPKEKKEASLDDIAELFK